MSAFPAGNSRIDPGHRSPEPIPARGKPAPVPRGELLARAFMFEQIPCSVDDLISCSPWGTSRWNRRCKGQTRVHHNQACRQPGSVSVGWWPTNDQEHSPDRSAIRSRRAGQGRDCGNVRMIVSGQIRIRLEEWAIGRSRPDHQEPTPERRRSSHLGASTPG